MKSKDRPPRRRNASGFTLLEVIVTLAVIAVLAALLIPAVQSVRAVSHRIRCQNNQRQIMLAMHAYTDSYTVMPPASIPSNTELCRAQTALTFLLPVLAGSDKCQLLTGNVSQIPVLLCPSDGTAATFPAPMSYVTNASPGLFSGSLAHGPFLNGRVMVPLAAITDGLSQTAAISERLAPWADGTSDTAARQPLRYFWLVVIDPPSPETLDNPTSPQALAEWTQLANLSIQDCRMGPRTFISREGPTLQLHGFASWGISGGDRSYSHWIPPNTPSCGSADSSFIQSSSPSSSAHTGGVNVAYLDGHVRFVGENIDPYVWRAAGTQDGGESDSAGSQE